MTYVKCSFIQLQRILNSKSCIRVLYDERGILTRDQSSISHDLPRLRKHMGRLAYTCRLLLTCCYIKFVRHQAQLFVPLIFNQSLIMLHAYLRPLLSVFPYFL